MAEVTAAAVNAFRKETGLPLMDCKAALTEAGGDPAKAKEILRTKGKTLAGGRGDRETTFGRYGIYKSLANPGVGAMVELKCESAPVASNEEFIALADGLAQQLATGPGANTADELLDLCDAGRIEGVRQQAQHVDVRMRIELATAEAPDRDERELAGQVGLSGHLTVHEGSVVYAQSGVGGDVEKGSRISGSPAFEARQWLRAQNGFQKLPELIRTVRQLERRLNELEAAQTHHE